MPKKMTFNRSPEESNFVSKVERYIRTTFRDEAWFLKVGGNAAQRSGVPDIIICLKGKLIAIELKREDGSGRASKQQIIECKKINKAGGIAIVSDDFKEVKNLLTSIYNTTLR